MRLLPEFLGEIGAAKRQRMTLAEAISGSTILGSDPQAAASLWDAVGVVRYVLEEGSASGHCCFTWSVLDMHHPTMNYEKDKVIGHETVAECFDKATAELIATALNRQAA